MENNDTKKLEEIFKKYESAKFLKLVPIWSGGIAVSSIFVSITYEEPRIFFGIVALFLFIVTIGFLIGGVRSEGKYGKNVTEILSKLENPFDLNVYVANTNDFHLSPVDVKEYKEHLDSQQTRRFEYLVSQSESHFINIVRKYKVPGNLNLNKGIFYPEKMS